MEKAKILLHMSIDQKGADKVGSLWKNEEY